MTTTDAPPAPDEDTPADIDLAALHEDAWRLSPDTFAVKLSKGEYEAAPHIRYLARRVRETIIKPNGRLIICMPPRHSKSELVSRWSIAWAFGIRPSIRVLLASYADGFAGEWGRSVRNTLIEHRDALPEVRIAQDSSAQAMWRTTAGGGMWTAGPQGTMTGRGGDLVVLDDMHKNFVEAHSAAHRQKVWDFYTAVARTRLQKNASVIVVMTRWHEDDLVGRLLANADSGGEQWELINMPAVAEEHEEWDLGNGETWTRDEGDPLWPDMFDSENLAATRSVLSAYMWSGLYQQHPAPAEGGMVKRDWWKSWRALPDRIDQRLISVDTTFKDGDGTDYVVMQAWARAGGSFYLVDQFRAHLNYPEFKKALLLFLKAHPGYRNKVLIEESANGPAVIAELKGSTPGLVPRRAEGSKESRVNATVGLVEAGNVWLPDADVCDERLAEQVTILIEEAAEFPTGKHDDTVDGWTQALLEFTIYPTKGVKASTPAKRGKARLPGGPSAAGLRTRTTHTGR